MVNLKNFIVEKGKVNRNTMLIGDIDKTGLIGKQFKIRLYLRKSEKIIF